MTEATRSPLLGTIIDQDYALDDCYRRKEGRVYLTGLQALVRLPMAQARLDRRQGLKTAGLVTGYRGSPLAGYDSALKRAEKHLKAHEVQFIPAINEELAATMIAGSQQAEADGQSGYDGVFGIWYGKGPGVDRAGDALKHGHAYGSSPHGGALIVAGDDHGAVSSTISHQSDQAFQAWSMPVVHPVDLEDYLKLGLYGIALSRFSGAWVGFKAITETVEGGRTVTLHEDEFRFMEPADFTAPPGGLHFRYSDPPSVAIEERLTWKLAAARAFARANEIDDLVIANDQAWLGIITVGKAHGDLMAAFAQLGFNALAMRQLGIRLLNIKQTFPIEPENTRNFARGLKQLLVVEEKRPLVEDQIKTLLYGLSERPAILGKFDHDGAPLLPDFGEFRPHQLASVAADLLQKQWPNMDLAPKLWRSVEAEKIKAAAVKRIPHFCSGCPHNSSTKLPDDAVAFGGIGCHVMATWMDRGTRGIVQMGGEGSNWVGLQPFTKRGHAFQNLGDGTYFHSGLLSIRQAVAAKTPITFKILFNDAVAMTGGQAFDGTLTVPRIAQQLHHEGVRKIVIVSDDTAKYRGKSGLPPGLEIFHRRDLLSVQRDLAAFDDVSALIYDQTCAAEKRRRRKRGTMADPAQFAVINDAVCEACGDCSVQSNCLSVYDKPTEFGTKRQIDQSSCNKDFSCTDGFCPSFVTVRGGKLKRAADADLRAQLLAKTADLPAAEPITTPIVEIAVTGVGGTGVLTVGALIAMAAHLEGAEASVLDFTGLAQKGGAVLSHLRIARGQTLHQARIEPGDAHAVIACDLVVAADLDALRLMRRGRTRVVGNAQTLPTSGLIKDPRFRIDQAKLIERMTKRTGSDTVTMIDAGKLATKLFGDSIYTNVMMLGFAFQQGLVPVGQAALERAITLNGVAVETNLEAFALGRLAAARPNEMAELLAETGKIADPATMPVNALIDHRAADLAAYQNQAYADRYRALVSKVAAAEAALGDAGAGQALTRAVARNLHKLMAYKDEYEVARLYSDGRFQQQLAEQFDGDVKLELHLAPPVLSWFNKRDGKQQKRTFGPWILPLFKLLVHGKRLRGTIFDPFGYQAERADERALIRDYEAMIETLLTELSPQTLDKATKLAGLPDQIRGYGHVKAAAIERYRTAVAQTQAA